MQPQPLKLRSRAQLPGGATVTVSLATSRAVRDVAAPGAQGGTCWHQRTFARHLAAAGILGTVGAVHPAAGAHAAAHLGVACGRGRGIEGGNGERGERAVVGVAKRLGLAVKSGLGYCQAGREGRR